MPARTIEQLYTERRELVTEARKLVDTAETEKREMTEAEQKRFEELMAKQATVRTNIERQEALDLADREIDRVKDETRRRASRATGVDPKTRRSGGRPSRRTRKERERDAQQHARDLEVAFQGWCRFQLTGERTPRQRAAMKRCKISPFAKRLRFDPLPSERIAEAQEQLRTVHPAQAKRALSTLTTAGGGVTVPPTFVSSLEIAMLTWNYVRRVATVFRTSTGSDMPWPTANDTSNSGRIVGEAATAFADVDPTFGAVILGAFKYTSDAVKVPWELLEDGAMDLARRLGEWLGMRIGRVQNLHFTTGTGNSMPLGLTPGVSVGKTAAGAAVTGDELIDLFFSVNDAYRIAAEWMMADTTIAAIAKLKGSDNNYLWQPGLQAGVPDMLLGKRVNPNNDMPAIASGNRSILWGDFSKYLIRDVGQSRLYRLEELYRENDQDGFVLFERCDAAPIDAGTGPIKCMVHP